jgi:hypothetical protein
VQWLRNHWHIADVTARYANGQWTMPDMPKSGSRVVAKSAESEEPVFTSMEVLLYLYGL